MNNFYDDKNIPEIERIASRLFFVGILIFVILMTLPLIIATIFLAFSGEILGFIGCAFELVSIFLIVYLSGNNNKNLNKVPDIIMMGQSVQGKLVSFQSVRYNEDTHYWYLFDLGYGQYVKSSGVESYMKDFTNVVSSHNVQQYFGVATLDLIEYEGNYYIADEVKKHAKINN